MARWSTLGFDSSSGCICSNRLSTSDDCIASIMQPPLHDHDFIRMLDVPRSTSSLGVADCLNGCPHTTLITWRWKPRAILGVVQA